MKIDTVYKHTQRDRLGEGLAQSCSERESSSGVVVVGGGAREGPSSQVLRHEVEPPSLSPANHTFWPLLLDVQTHFLLEEH